MSETGLAGLEMLEEKITRAATLIERLRAEKNEFETANKELKAKIENLYIHNEELTQRLEELTKERENASDFEKTREEIKGKIEEMLGKLEGLEI
ncbi:MAG: hypothetical protein JW876_03920 [Candidatus Krumholzibacteriota bacterium]|nr:hypothetical protein [Candidatus Krumholzibacteriota bacterium]